MAGWKLVGSSAFLHSPFGKVVEANPLYTELARYDDRKNALKTAKLYTTNSRSSDMNTHPVESSPVVPIMRLGKVVGYQYDRGDYVRLSFYVEAV